MGITLVDLRACNQIDILTFEDLWHIESDHIS